MYITTIYQDDKRIREVNHGFKEPTAEEMRKLDCTPDPEYIARGGKGVKKEKLEEQAMMQVEKEKAD